MGHRSSFYSRHLSKWEHFNANDRMMSFRCLSRVIRRGRKMPVGIFRCLPSVAIPKYGVKQKRIEQDGGNSRKPERVGESRIQFWRIKTTVYRECSIYFGGEPIKWHSVRQFFFSTKALRWRRKQTTFTQLYGKEGKKKSKVRNWKKETF